MADRDRMKRWEGDERREPALVLIAGDLADSNELISRVLVSEGYRTATVDTVDAALIHIVEHRPRVVVVDLSSRGIGTSLRLLDLIRSHDSEVVRRTRVIVVARSRANRTFTFQSGADGFLLRPYHAAELVTMIETVLAVPEDGLPAHRHEMTAHRP